MRSATFLDAPAGSFGGSANIARDDYIERLSAFLGPDRTRMIASAWSDGAAPAWLTDHKSGAAPERPARGSARRSGRLASTIRQTTTACVLAALGSCLFLYWGKSQAALVDREIGRIVRATEAAHARVYALRTEWALLNQPDRLQDLAGHYLKLQPVAPAQFAEAARLGSRLGEPVQTPMAALPEDVVESDAAPAPAVVAQATPGSATLASPDAAGAPAEQAAPASGIVPTLPRAAMAEAAGPAIPASPQAPPLRVARFHAPARAMPATRYLPPIIAEARQPVRVRDSGEALLNGDPEPVRMHSHLVRDAAAYALPARPWPAPLVRPARHLPPSRIDLPGWLMHAHLVRQGRSEPPHALAVPQETAIPLAAPLPAPAKLQRVAIQQADTAEPADPADRAYEPPPRERPAYRRNFGYGNPYYYRPYGGYYGAPYGNYYPPPVPNGYYQ